MTNPLTELADRCERAVGPDRELDALIFRAIGAPVPFQFMNKLLALEYNDVEQAYFARVSDDMQVRYSPPAYTASIDAAMTLVPEGWVVGEMSWWPHSKSATCHMDDQHKLKACSGAVSLPLALCAAALRAISKGEGE